MTKTDDYKSAVRYHDLSMVVAKGESKAETELHTTGSHVTGGEITFVFVRGDLQWISPDYLELHVWENLEDSYDAMSEDVINELGVADDS